MKAIYAHTAAALALTFGLAACIPASAPPSPVPPPVTRPAPAPTPTPAPPPPPVVQEPVFANYLDAPQTPGTWTYAEEPGETLALFGTSPSQPVFIMRCAAGGIGLARSVSSQSAASRAMSIKTETVTRQLTAAPVTGRPGLVALQLNPADPLLDAMAITKGRFAVGLEGERTLYLPSWVEVSRLIEDCR